MASVRADGRPHLVPVWFVVSGQRWYVSIEPDSVKARNIATNPRVSLALEDCDSPYILQGSARPSTITAVIAQLFKAKYDWDITTEQRYNAVYEITIERRLMMAKD
jgi:general stress protein 26